MQVEGERLQVINEEREGCGYIKHWTINRGVQIDKRKINIVKKKRGRMNDEKSDVGIDGDRYIGR